MEKKTIQNQTLRTTLRQATSTLSLGDSLSLFAVITSFIKSDTSCHVTTLTTKKKKWRISMEGNRCHVQSINKTRGDRGTSVCVTVSRSCAKALFVYMIALPLVNIGTSQWIIIRNGKIIVLLYSLNKHTIVDCSNRELPLSLLSQGYSI